MGDRISISFKNGDDESVALFSHWDGEDFLDKVNEYLNVLKELIETDNDANCTKIMPLGRLEPSTVMVDFIRYTFLTHGTIAGNYYLGKDKDDGDNSDNGHYVVNLDHLWSCNNIKDIFSHIE